MDVYYCVSAGDSRTLPASMALWDDLEPRLISERINKTIKLRNKLFVLSQHI